jgi:hypothetical protein
MPAFSWDAFTAVADRVAGPFVERTNVITELVDSSILLSDGLCVCALCELLAVDHLVEAGTGFGGSTEMFARYFQDESFSSPKPQVPSPHGSRVRRIWSIDQAVNPRFQRILGVLRLKHYGRYVWSSDKRARQIARRRLLPFPNVTLLRGDANEKLPELVDRLVGEGARVGLVIDGPKGDEQLRLAEAAMRRSPLVTFAALDDVGPLFDGEGREARFRGSPYAAFVTSDRQYFDRYGWVNAGRVPERMAGRPEHTGYGMGVLVNTESAS